jgi:hypothetical protein
VLRTPYHRYEPFLALICVIREHEPLGSVHIRYFCLYTHDEVP